MTIKATPFVLVSIVFPFKLWVLLKDFDVFNVLTWCVGSGIWLWITWRYWKNRDMPAYSGIFRYEDGKNQFARKMYVSSTVIVYLIAAFANWK